MISVIIPAYNSEKTIKRCLDSVLKQDIKCEIIVVNDGSIDNTKSILDSYKNRIVVENLVLNQGQGNARNIGVSKCTGEYILFLDSDDYLNDKALLTLEKYISNYTFDLLSYSLNVVSTSGKCIGTIKKPQLGVCEGEKVIINYINNNVSFDAVCGYLYNREFYIKNNFKFDLNRSFEDFALVPYILIKAQNVMSLDECLYQYVQTESSITRGNNLEKERTNFEDKLYHFDNLKLLINTDKNIGVITKKYFNSFLANSIFLSYNHLNKQLKKRFIKLIKNRNISSMLMADNIKRKLKKIYYKLFF